MKWHEKMEKVRDRCVAKARSLFPDSVVIENDARIESASPGPNGEKQVWVEAWVCVPSNKEK